MMTSEEKMRELAGVEVMHNAGVNSAAEGSPATERSES